MSLFLFLFDVRLAEVPAFQCAALAYILSSIECESRKQKFPSFLLIPALRLKMDTIFVHDCKRNFGFSTQQPANRIIHIQTTELLSISLIQNIIIKKIRSCNQ
jgi:hypothetical protein